MSGVAGGIVLVASAVAALLFANSPWAQIYWALLDTSAGLHVGPVQFSKPLLAWINEGLMTVFFFLVGLELKREALEGALSRRAQLALPAAAAVGGMALPAAIYSAFNHTDAVALQGWAIPAATDIAFAAGVLALLGARIPYALKVFVLTLAVLDDLGAIVVIALFYSADLSTHSLAIAACAIAGLWMMNRRGVAALPPYSVGARSRANRRRCLGCVAGETARYRIAPAFRIGPCAMTSFSRAIRNIIGAASFHGPVRDGKEWGQRAMVVGGLSAQTGVSW